MQKLTFSPCQSELNTETTDLTHAALCTRSQRKNEPLRLKFGKRPLKQCCLGNNYYDVIIQNTVLFTTLFTKFCWVILWGKCLLECVPNYCLNMNVHAMVDIRTD